MRITVDGIPEETSTKRKWDLNRWDQKSERAIGNKEDAWTINHFLDSLEVNLKNYLAELIYNGRMVTA